MTDPHNTLRDELFELMSKGVTIETARHFGEPGYAKDPGKAEDILLANWNEVSDELFDRLEAAGYTLLWSDEWYLDDDHDKVWRSEPDSYWWKSSIAYGESRVLTPDDDPLDWLEEFGNTDTVIPERAPLPEGFIKVAQVPYSDMIPPVLRALMEVWPHVLCRYGSDSAIHFYAGNRNGEEDE